MSVRVDRRTAIEIFGASLTVAAMRPLQAPAQTLTTVRVGAGLDDGLTPLLYALQTGMFKKAGLDVQLQSASNGAALAAAVAGGAIDVAKSALMSLITAYSRGLRFKIIAGAAQYRTVAPTDLLCVLKSSPIKSMADANGKTIAVATLKGLDMMATQVLIDKNGGNSSTVKFIETPFATMLSVLEQGRADIASISNPALSAALESGKLRSFGDPYGAIAPRFLIAGWFTTTDYARQNPTVVDRFSKVMRDASAYANAHHAETAPILAEYAHIDTDVVLKMNRLENATTLGPQLIQPAIDAAAKYKYIEAGFSAKELLL
ncbi:MAG TPA: ABC transporter substrate-binding protein [Candidatus Binatia bacterium]|nr:ABC transporter substrate-binding protein [Candidatus Binatia bacterium]